MRSGRRQPRTTKSSRTDPDLAPEGRDGQRRAISAAPLGGRGILLGIALFAAVFLAFWPAIGGDFVNWDDPNTVQNNSNCHGLDAARLRWMFSTFYWGHYQPLVWLSYAVDYTWSRWLFGDGLRPAVYHFTSVLLHAANAVLLYILILRLLAAAEGARQRDGAERLLSGDSPSKPLRPPQSWAAHAAAMLATLLFAWNPLRVEPVAWVTGRGDVLVTFLLLLTALAYLRVVRAEGTPRHTMWLVIACAAFSGSLLTRAMAVTLPIVLLLLDWYPLRRLGDSANGWFGPRSRRVWLEKAPFLVLAAAAALIAPLAKASVQATVGWAAHDEAQRAAQACYGVTFYVWKTLLPLNLSPIYELRLPIRIVEPQYIISMLLLLLAAAAVALLLLKRRGRAIVCAVCAYVVLALPVLGLVQSGNQEVADRYGYLPSMPLAVLLAAGLLKLWQSRRLPSGLKLGTAGLGGLLAVVLVILTQRQCAVWRNSTTLWEHAALVSPNSSIALNGYGWILVDRKRFAEAVPYLRAAIDLQPANVKAHHNLWRALREQGLTDELLQAYRHSIQVYPDFFDAHENLGHDLLVQGRFDEAAGAYRAALKLRPNDSWALANMGKILVHQGDKQAAFRQYDLAIRADPKNVNARHGLALLLYEQGRKDEAMGQLRAALDADPNYKPVKDLLDLWTKGPGSGS